MSPKRKPQKEPRARAKTTQQPNHPTTQPPNRQQLAALHSALEAIKSTLGPYTIAEPDHATAPVVIVLPLTIGYCTHCKSLRLYPEMLTIHQCQHCK